MKAAEPAKTRSINHLRLWHNNFNKKGAGRINALYSINLYHENN